METVKFEGKMPENDEEFVKFLIFLYFLQIPSLIFFKN